MTEPPIANFPDSQLDERIVEKMKDAGMDVGFTLRATSTFFLGGIFILLLLTTCYFAADILLPIFLALLMKFVLHPLVRVAQRWHIPPLISSIFIIVLLFSALALLAVAVSEPLGVWTGRLQEALPHLRHKVELIRSHITGMQEAINNAEHIVPGGDTKAMIVAVRGTTLADRLLAGTGHLASGLAETVVILLFLLISGDTFLRRVVEILPRFEDKRHAVAISQQVESDLSAYLLTITFANIGVGLATGLAMRTLGIEDPLLWGVLAFTLNYVPIIGPISMTGIIFLVGSLSENLVGDGSTLGLIPAAVFFAIHLAESQLITPMLLARRFTLNPVFVVMALIFWFWMWGIIGAIVSTPMLAVAKIIFDRIEPLKPLGHLIEGNGGKVTEKA